MNDNLFFKIAIHSRIGRIEEEICNIRAEELEDVIKSLGEDIYHYHIESHRIYNDDDENDDKVNLEDVKIKRIKK